MRDFFLSRREGGKRDSESGCGERRRSGRKRPNCPDSRERIRQVIWDGLRTKGVVDMVERGDW
jgi:hypothetical protein